MGGREELERNLMSSCSLSSVWHAWAEQQTYVMLQTSPPSCMALNRQAAGRRRHGIAALHSSFSHTEKHAVKDLGKN